MCVIIRTFPYVDVLHTDVKPDNWVLRWVVPGDSPPVLFCPILLVYYHTTILTIPPVAMGGARRLTPCPILSYHILSSLYITYYILP